MLIERFEVANISVNVGRADAIVENYSSHSRRGDYNHIERKLVNTPAFTTFQKHDLGIGQVRVEDQLCRP